MTTLLALTALALSGVLADCRGRPMARPGSGVENVVLVLVDTLRVDHLSLYGYHRETTPYLDRLAGEFGIVFEGVRAQAPCTFPSVNSILTSRSPGAFYAGLDENGFGIPTAIPSIAELLHGAGFATAAFSASPIVRATPSDENPAGGFGAGFESFDEFCKWREAACVLERARPVLEKLSEPFFVYLHFMEPHDPYRAQPFPNDRHPFAVDPPSDPAKEWVRLGDPRPVADHLYQGAPDPGLTEADLRYLVALYDEEILYWDSQLRKLLALLERRGALERTAIAIVSDHGEEFLEHGHVKHCRTLYDNEVHVPLVFLLPGQAPKRISTPVSNLDITPTLLDLAGVLPPTGVFEGRSLRSFFGATDGLIDRPQFASYGQARSITAGRFKLIERLRDRTAELYDLETDPGETRSLAASHPEELRRLHRLLAAWRRSSEPASDVGNDDETAQRLRAVGYLD